MRIVRVLGCFVVFFAYLLLSLPASAQIDQGFETGINPYRSYQSGNIDTINTWNGQLNVNIPIVSYPQRGGKLQLNFVLHYTDLGNWYDEDCSPEPCSYTLSKPYPSTGWGVIQAGTISSAWGTCGTDSTQPQDNICNYSVGFADGSGSSLLPTGNTTWKSPDLQGIQLLNYNSIHPTESSGLLLSDRNGISYGANSLPPPGSLLPLFSYAINTNPPGEVEDTNGNYITYQPYGAGLSPGIGWTDTMGRNVPLPISTTLSASSGASACPQTPLVPDSAYLWNFPGVNGGTYAVKFCYAEVAYNIRVPPGYTPTGNLDELQSVLLPNGTSWTFQYSTDGNADLSKITFPTGGTLSYTYANYGSDPCAIHAMTNLRQVATRTLNANSSDSSSGVWTYGNGVVTDPAGNDTVRSFSTIPGVYCPLYETTAQYYSGSHTSGTLLKTVKTGYSPAVTGGGNGIGFPTTTNVLWPNNQQNQISTTYDNALTLQNPVFVAATSALAGPLITTPNASYGLPLTKKEYDYSTSPPPVNLLRTTTTTYEALSNSNYLTNNLLELPASVVVTGSGPGSTTTYLYDQPSTLVSSGITTMHSSAGTYRGNPTTVSRYLNTSGTYLNTTSTNWDTGMPDIVTDPKGNHTTYGYSSTYIGAYLTSATNALGQLTTYTYDFNSGLLASMTDANNQMTSATYDEMGRPLSISYPDNGKTTYSYNDAAPAPTATTTTLATPDPSITSVQTFDGLGRPYQTQITSVSPTITNYMTYDALGRASSVYNPTGCNPPTTNCSESTWGYATTAYDALSRPSKITEQDNSIITYAYTGPCTTVTDEASKTRETCADGLGRMTEVIENPGGLGYITNYTYDVLGDLLGVVQNGSHPRSFIYDSLGRLTSSTNPESGTTTYSYDANGNVTTETAPAPNQTGSAQYTAAMTYDAGNRILTKSYTGGSPTAALSFTYDVSSVDSLTGLTYTTGRLVKGSAVSSAGTTSYYLDYDKMGRTAEVWNCPPAYCPSTWHASYTYDYAGDVYAYSDSVFASYGQTFDGAGRLTKITSTYPSGSATTLASVNNYFPPGEIQEMAYGNGLAASNGYNSRLQPCRITFNTSAAVLQTCVAATPSGNFIDFAYGYNQGSGPSDNGSVASWTAAGKQTFSHNYTYDNVNRISSMTGSGGACTALNWTYDAWGNRTGQTAPPGGGTCLQPQFTYLANNQMSGYGYDSAGNLTSQTGATYTYDNENRLVAQTTSGVSATYIYDASGRRVQKNVGSTPAYFYAYNKDGQVYAWLTPSGRALGYVYMNGQILAQYYNGAVYFHHHDHLGSTRLVTATNQATQQCMGYYPFGEEDANQCTPTVANNFNDAMFTGKERDTESNLDNFEARYMASSLGRFMSPDPSGLAYADATNPQSLNLYSYVLNNPLKFIDPTGKYCYYGDTSSDSDDWSDNSEYDFRSNYSECTKPDENGNSGKWFDDPSSTVTVNGNTYDVDTVSTSTGNVGPTPVMSTQTFHAENRPIACSGLALKWQSLEWTGKAGPEFELGPVDIGMGIFKNFTTGEKGAEMGANFSNVLGVSVMRVNPPYAAMNSTAGPLELHGQAFGFDHNFTGGGTQTNFGSKSIGGNRGGVMLGVGFEVSLNGDTFNSLAANCDIVY